VSTERKPQPKRRKTSLTPVPPGPVAGSLIAEALADLHYLEPLRSRNRLISILEEFGRRIVVLEEMHRDSH
jgi:hypothetical protein